MCVCVCVCVYEDPGENELCHIFADERLLCYLFDCWSSFVLTQ